MSQSRLRKLVGLTIALIVLLSSSLFGVNAQDNPDATTPNFEGVNAVSVHSQIEKEERAIEGSTIENANGLRSELVNYGAPDLNGPEEPTSGLITAYVRLQGASAGQSFEGTANPWSQSATAAANSRAAAVEAQQRSVGSSLASATGGRVVGNITWADNALIMNVDASQLEAIRNTPGVIGAFPDQIGQLDNANSVPFVGGAAAWTALGSTGAGIRIGIIDSGIDYIHANFGGSGSAAVYAGDDSADVSDNLAELQASKVVTGYDFVGEGWAGGPLLGTGATPHLWLGAANPFGVGDNDPIDCNGHGSHVAGTAGGFGVNAGTTYPGPWDNSAPFSTMDIGPGMAPEAELYALKIGDCASAVSFAAAALSIQFAFDPNGDSDASDRLHVTNNSYGGAYGQANEVLQAWYDVAASSGIVMVGSAGNSGNTYFINGDANVSEWNIATASSINDTVYSGLQIDAGDGSLQARYGAGGYPFTIAANSSTGGATGTFGSFNLQVVGAAGGGNSQGCNVADYAGFAGEVGFISWTDGANSCGSGTRMTNAVNNGNVAGLVVASADPADAPFINLFCGANGGTSSIPCVSITGVDGADMAANIGAFQVTFDSSLTAALPDGFSVGDTLSGFTSRGPRSNVAADDIFVKPDVTAPGNTIVSTAVGTGNGASTLGGTSMAAPHVAGLAALVVQENPSWDVPAIKAAIMNTATNDLWTQPNQSGDRYPISRIGAGRIDAVGATTTEIIAYGTEAPWRVSLSFGRVEAVGPTVVQKTITIDNRGGSSETYNVTFDTVNDLPNAAYTVSPSQVTVGAGSTATVTVTLTVDPSIGGSYTPDVTTSLTQGGVFGQDYRHWLEEEAGYVVLTPTVGAQLLRVPTHAVVRAASDMAAASNPLPVGPLDTGTAFLELAGTDFSTGFGYPNSSSMVTALELVYEDPQDQPTAFLNNYSSGDVQYVGLMSDYQSLLALTGDPATAIANTTIYVGISTYGDWGTSSGFDAWFDVFFDIDEDNTVDQTIFNFESGFFASTDFTDTSYTYRTPGGSWFWGENTGGVFWSDYVNDIPAPFLDTRLLSTNVIVMPLSAAAIGLTVDNTDFNLGIDTLSTFTAADSVGTTRNLSGVTSNQLDGTISWDVAASPYSFGDLNGWFGGPLTNIPTWQDADGFVIPVDYDVTGLATFPDIMLIHHHNAADAAVGRAERVPVIFDNTADGAVTITVDNQYPVVGDNVTFTVNLLNNGPASITDPIITTDLPIGVSYVSTTCPTATVGGETTIACDAAGVSLPVSGTFSYDVVGNIAFGDTDMWTNASYTAPSLNDPIPQNDSAAVVVCVNGTPGEECPRPGAPVSGTPPSGIGGGGDTAGVGGADALADVTSLPATGEVPWWRDMTVAILAALGGLALLGGAVAVRRNNA